MKKIISVILAVVIIFSATAAVVSASEKCSCGMTPVIQVVGFGEEIYINPESDDRVSVLPPSEESIISAVPDLLAAVVGGLLPGNLDLFGDYAIKAVDKILAPAALDKEGNALNNTGVVFSPVPEEDTHKKTAFVSLEGDNGFFSYLYDWRIDPIENAKGLKEYIGEVKKLTGHNEVVITCHSQGNTVVTSYLHLYGSEGIEKLIFLSPAYKGLSLIGSLFTQGIDVSEKGNAFIEFIKSIMGYDDVKSQLIGAVMSEINSYGVLDSMLSGLQKVLDSQLDRIIDESLKDILGTLPGIWSFVPDEYYEDAKEYMFKGSEDYRVLIEKLDYYHYNVQNNVEKLLTQAKSQGTSIVISAGYNISSIPVTDESEEHSDTVIDTDDMTLGATIAPFGESLGEDYEQANTRCGHNHVSADSMIDASTCGFPEYTWFFSGNGHNSFDTVYCEFIEWAIRFDGQPTVHSSEKYPQFLMIKDGETVPVIDAPTVEARTNIEIIISSLIAIIKEMFSKLSIEC